MKKYIWIGKSKNCTAKVIEKGYVKKQKILYTNFFNLYGLVYCIFSNFLTLLSIKLKIWVWNITIEITDMYDIKSPMLNIQKGLYISIK